MNEPAVKRPRTPAAIALAIMLLACMLIVTALALLAQGAVAYELPADRLADPSGARAPAATARNPVSEQSDARLETRRTIDRSRPAQSGRHSVSGSFVLGAEPTPAERALQDRIASSSTGGGFAARGQLHVIVEGGAAADEPAQP